MFCGLSQQFLSVNLKPLFQNNRVFSITLDGDYNSSPSDTQSASNAWAMSSSTVTDSETDNDAVLPAATGGP